MTTHAPTGIDLADSTTFVEHDLTAFWRGLRDEKPVYWNAESEQRPGFWVLSRHRDVVGVYRDAENFSSAHGNVLDTLLNGGDSASGKMLAISDGSGHRELRRTLLRSFAPRALQVVEANMRAATDKVVAEAVRQGTCDFAADVAAHIPLATICDMLGVPDAQRAEVQRTAKSALAAEEPGQDAMRSWLAKNEILMYFAKLAKTRAGDPGTDVVSMLATCEVNGRPLSEDEIILNCYGLVLGGEETTRLTMIGAVAAFLAHPDQWRRLRTGEVELATAVDEILRWTTVTRHVGRRATADVRLHDTLIRAGDIVTLWHASANFDEREFTDPMSFDLSRKPNNHVVFGHGPHFCIGAYLGRAEISALLSALCAHVQDFEATAPPENLYSTVFSGYASLPVRLVPAA
ncbi:cytochrome [Saccharothrix sp. ALI-22-I]|uniref:cytochrome P450 n=1 Tax=Saccharothrix sp. ALI-22-I TaxID=1933778 RepID=UPI00097C4A4D|nr:cytochrome P450 [Saccharothrix sp. ALI-22-I]ONI88800.1 cytochrome [Saccharothrix sp. ALI-22-I]